MNQPSTDSSISSRNDSSSDAVSRRAYEIWEREGRPEGCDLRHWLQAEQELGAEPSENRNATASSARTENHANRASPPTQNRVTASVAPARDTKRAGSGTTPPTGERTGTGAVSGQNVAKRKPASAPVM